MSTRFHICSITSIAPIRDIVATNDSALVDALVQRHESALRQEYDGDDPDEDELDDFREAVEEMVNCKSPPKIEPGAWTYVFDTLTDHFNLQRQDDYPINEDWKHEYVWGPYRKLLAKSIPKESDALIRHLQDGRPLRGSKVEHDGCVFGWLESSEVAVLHESLANLGDSVVTDPELTDFHSAFVESVAQIKSRNADLLLGAQ